MSCREAFCGRSALMAFQTAPMHPFVIIIKAPRDVHFSRKTGICCVVYVCCVIFLVIYMLEPFVRD